MSSRSVQPAARRSHAAVGAGTKQYVWGGHPVSSTTTLESFDILSLTWEKPKRLLGSLPDGLWDMAITSEGDTAYSFGGRTGSYPACTYFNTLYQINLSTLECKELVPENPSQAPTKTACSGVVYFNGKLVVYGGYTGQERTDELHVFDLRTSECTEGIRSGWD